MSRYILMLCALLALGFGACQDEEAKALRERLQADYTLSDEEYVGSLSSGSKIQYIEMERRINQSYIEGLDSLISTGFERQLERLEDEELGFWSGYMRMFSWLFRSKQSWDDEMIVLSNKYFSPLDIEQEQHLLYVKYTERIGELRHRFASSKGLPMYAQIDLPSERAISLGAFSEHSRNNMVLELGTEIFGWILTFTITQAILFFLGKYVAGGWSCLVDIIVFVIVVGISIVMSSSNDAELMNSHSTIVVLWSADRLFV